MVEQHSETAPNSRGRRARSLGRQANFIAIIVIVIVWTLAFSGLGHALTVDEALVAAYQNNPQLNAQRALVRATDEKVPQALSGYRPKINVTATAGYQYDELMTGTGAFQQRLQGASVPRSAGASITQTVFNGFQTANRVRSGEAEISAAREGLEVLEQAILLAAATSYMDYLRDWATVAVQRTNIRSLELVLSQTLDRFRLKEVTLTDIAQARTQLASARGQFALSEANLAITSANFRKITGLEPKGLAPGSPIDQLAPGTIAQALRLAADQHPRIRAAAFGIDVAFLQTKINEGALFPTVAVTASAQKQYDTSLQVGPSLSAAVGAQISIPIFQGGAEYSLIRQSKEALAQQRQISAQTRDEVQALVAQQWAQLKAARFQLGSAQEQVAAAEMALDGVSEEARQGQRTTFDVLNAQQALLVARLALINSQRDRVVASYGFVASTGRLSPKTLRLPIPLYDASVHYHAVRDTWAGLRSSSGN